MVVISKTQLVSCQSVLKAMLHAALQDRLVVAVPERGAPPLPICAESESERTSCPSPSLSLCTTGQWGVSSASPIVWGESLATAGMATAPVATEPNNQKDGAWRDVRPREDLSGFKLRSWALPEWMIWFMGCSWEFSPLSSNWITEQHVPASVLLSTTWISYYFNKSSCWFLRN